MKTTNENIRSGIIANWNKLYLDENFHPSEASYYLFDNLFRGLRHNPSFMKELYRTLIELNENERNYEMVAYLNEKEKEFFSSHPDNK